MPEDKNSDDMHTSTLSPENGTDKEQISTSDVCETVTQENNSFSFQAQKKETQEKDSARFVLPPDTEDL